MVLDHVSADSYVGSSSQPAGCVRRSTLYKVCSYCLILHSIHGAQPRTLRTVTSRMYLGCQSFAGPVFVSPDRTVQEDKTRLR